VLDRTVLAVLERKPTNRSLLRVDNQHLADIVSGIERELLPALITRDRRALLTEIGSLGARDMRRRWLNLRPVYSE
jgi:hypothetical protein